MLMQHVPSASWTDTVIAPGLGTVVTLLQHLCDKTLTLETIENILLNSVGPELTLMHFFIIL